MSCLKELEDAFLNTQLSPRVMQYESLPDLAISNRNHNCNKAKSASSRPPPLYRVSPRNVPMAPSPTSTSGRDHKQKTPSRRGQYNGRKSKAAKKSNSNKPDNFPFLALPKELRDIIYDLSIPDFSGITRNFEKQQNEFIQGMSKINQKNRQHVARLFYDMSRANWPRKRLNVLLLNKQIKDEATYHLKHRTITINHGIVNNNLFPFKEMIGAGILRTVGHIHITMSMRSHTPDTMLGEILEGSNWYDHDLGHYGDKSLDKPDFWLPTIDDLFTVLRKPGYQACKLTLSIKDKDSTKDYVLVATPEVMSHINGEMKACTKTKSLTQWLEFLETLARDVKEDGPMSYQMRSGRTSRR